MPQSWTGYLSSRNFEVRKGYDELRPVVVQLVKRLHRKTKAGQMSFRAISIELAKQGYVKEGGKVFNPKSAAVMLAV